MIEKLLLKGVLLAIIIVDNVFMGVSDSEVKDAKEVATTTDDELSWRPCNFV